MLFSVNRLHSGLPCFAEVRFTAQEFVSGHVPCVLDLSNAEKQPLQWL